MSVIEQARSPLPEGMEKYAGRWVAIRGDDVVADAETVEALVADKRVRPTDVLYRVPERGSYFY